ncbi:thymidylate synthase [Bacillus sp. 7586-K]|nr:thymidylate synthase [Bacillus sp. 7586-K]
MSQYDLKYNQIVLSVIANGAWDKDQDVRPKWSDGTPAYTKSLLDVQMKFDNGNEIPMLTTKAVPRKDPINEMFWIWKYKSNNVKILREELGCNVWNEWEREDNTIGKAYGWQLANKRRKVKVDQTFKTMWFNGEISNFTPIYNGDTWEYAMLDQVDYLLYTLKTNPYSRRIKTTLWCIEDLDDMALEPCVYETHWQMWDGKLNLTVSVRSNDLGLGNPYNVYQYSILHRLVAQVTNKEVGTICFNIDNAHVYERHIDPLLEQISRQTFEAPEVWINPDIKSFYDFTIDDIVVKNYKHGDKVKLEVAI